MILMIDDNTGLILRQDTCIHTGCLIVSKMNET